MMRFASPWWFLLLVLVAVRIGMLLYDRRRNTGAFKVSSLSIVRARRTLPSLLPLVPFALEIAAWTLLTVALARPQIVRSVAADDRYGIDMMIVLDESGSMAAEDFRPRNRFIVARELISRFIERRTNDRIGIVTFGVRAATRVPITFDREIAREILATTKIGENGDGTAIGQAVATAVNRLRTSKSRSRVIILLTDGVNNAGAIEPATAAALAKRLNIRVYTIGVGSQGEVPIPFRTQNPLTGQIETTYQMIRADLDEAMLDEMARVTGGAYFRAVDPGALEAVLGRIDQLEKSRLGAPKRQTVDEKYLRIAAAGLALLALSLTLGETRWMRLPV